VEIGAQLRALHSSRLIHGSVSPESVALRPGGAVLLPGNHVAESATVEQDVRGFGAVLYEIITRTRPPAQGPFGMPLPVGARKGPSAIRPSAQRLALRCLAAAVNAPPTMQQALNELRVLLVLARQHGFRPAPSPSALLPDPAPVVVLAPPPNPPPDVAPSIASRRAAMLARLVDDAFPVSAESPAAPQQASPPTPVNVARFGPAAPPPRPEPAPAEAGPCRQCASSEFFISRPRSRFERLLDSWDVPICRCHRCSYRWVVLAHMRFGKPIPSGSGAQTRRR
jgi:hypothetical protein